MKRRRFLLSTVALAGLHRREIDLGGRQGQRILGRVQAVDKRPDRAGRADARQRSGGQDQEIASRAAIMARSNLRMRQIGHPPLVICCCSADDCRRGKLYCEKSRTMRQTAA